MIELADEEKELTQEQCDTLDESVHSVSVEDSITVNFTHGGPVFSKTIRRGIVVAVPSGYRVEDAKLYARLQVKRWIDWEYNRIKNKLNGAENA